jgi:hypothetical protein
MPFFLPKYTSFPLFELLLVHRNLGKRRNHGLRDLYFLCGSVNGPTHFLSVLFQEYAKHRRLLVVRVRACKARKLRPEVVLLLEFSIDHLGE